MDGAAFGAEPSVARFFYLKHATSYAAVSSMALILYDFGELVPNARVCAWGPT